MKQLISSRNVSIVGKLCAVMLFVMLLCSSAWASSEPWNGTVGTLPTPEGNVYTITTPGQLAAVARVMERMTTLLASISLLIWGGDVLRSFSFTLVWGILIGTYSSIYVSAVILNFFDLRKQPDEKVINPFGNI